MTVQPQNLFRCNRCLDEIAVAIQNNPGHIREQGPDGWLAIKVGTDPSTPLSHLCPPCAFGFTAYMQDKTITISSPASSPSQTAT